jgi:hypothetical protein
LGVRFPPGVLLLTGKTGIWVIIDIWFTKETLTRYVLSEYPAPEHKEKILLFLSGNFPIK